MSPVSRTVHFNPPSQGFKTRCGRRLSSVVWRTDLSDVTCNNCIRLETQHPTEPIA